MYYQHGNKADLIKGKCDGCGKGYIGATRNSLVIRVAGYETYNIPLCNACLLSLKKKINKEENE